MTTPFSLAMSPENSTIPQSILDAALALHKQGNSSLSYEPTGASEPTTVNEHLLWSCVEGRIEFVNLEARNHCAALAVFQETGATDELFDAAYELWRKEVGHQDSAAGRLLGLTSQSLHVLMEAAKFIQRKPLHASEVFQILRLIEVALPYVSDIRADAVIALVSAQHAATKGDMASGMIFNAIETRLRTQPSLAWDILELIRKNMSESLLNLYGTALQSLMHTDQQPIALEMAIADADHIDPLIARSALWTLSRAIQVHNFHAPDVEKCVAILTSKTNAESIEVQQAAIRAVANAAMKSERLLSELVRLSAKHDDYTLSVIADFFFMNHKDIQLTSSPLKQLLNTLVLLPPTLKNLIDRFDWVLSQLYASPKNRSKVLDCLEKWIIQHGKTNLNNKSLIELFEQTIIQISNDTHSLQRLITSWLVSPENKLAAACAGLINYLEIRGRTSIRFSPETLNNFTPQDFKHLSRRMLGYVISEKALISLTFSMLETENATIRAFGWVQLLLTNEVGRDYEHATLEALKTRIEAAQSEEKELLEKINSDLIHRSAAIDGLPRLQELRPPMRLRRAIALSRARDMEIAKEAADEKSIIRSIATVIPTKAGRGFFSVSDSQVGPTQHFHGFSHSIAIPKRSITDPIGYAIDSLHYRFAKRDDE